jgi:hypothetical protein
MNVDASVFFTCWSTSQRYKLDVPTSGVELTGGPFETAFVTNLAYLGQFPVDDILYWFRERAGATQPAGATSWGWDGHVEQTSRSDASNHSHPHPHPHVVHNSDGNMGGNWSPMHSKGLSSDSATSAMKTSRFKGGTNAAAVSPPPPPPTVPGGRNVDGMFSFF